VGADLVRTRMLLIFLAGASANFKENTMPVISLGNRPKRKGLSLQFVSKRTPTSQTPSRELTPEEEARAGEAIEETKASTSAKPAEPSRGR